MQDRMEHSGERRSLAKTLAASIASGQKRSTAEWLAIDAIIAGIPDDDVHLLDVREERLKIRRAEACRN